MFSPRRTNLTRSRLSDSSVCSSKAPTTHTCNFGKCAYQSFSNVDVAVHEATNHCSNRFFCPVCDHDLSSFEALRTHCNSQHTRSRDFRCDICRTTYLDPARRAKCRKRHQGQYRCPHPGCKYHNCRPNSVTKHAKSQHGLDIEGSSLHFDKSLGTNEAPKTRRPPAVRGVQQAPKLVPYDLSDEELFKRSEVTREGKMRDLKIDHIRWFGSEAALHASVPNYPPFVPREHPYGRMTSASSMLMDGRSSTFASASPSSLTDLSLDSPHLLTGTIQPSSSSGLLPINEESDHWSFHSESSSNALQHAESWSTAPLFPPMASYSSHLPHPQLPPSSQPIAIPGIHAERIPYGSGDSLDFMLGPMGSPQTLPEQSFDPFTSFLHTTSSVDEETSMLASITSYAAGSFDGSIPPYPR